MLKDEIEKICEYAMDSFSHEGSIAPVLFGIFEGEKKMILLDFDVSKHKQVFADKIKSLISQGKLTEYILICEAWILRQNANEPLPNNGLKDHPKRQETILVQYCHPTEEIHFLCPIIRGIDNQYTFGEWEKLDVRSDVGRGRFQSLFAKGRAEWN